MDLKALNVFVFHRQAQEFMPLLPLGCDFRSSHWADCKKVMHFITLIILTEKKNTVAPSTGSVCHLEVILIEDLLVMTV